MGIKNFTELRVWQAARSITMEIYKVTRHFPIDERFALASQMRRAAISIGANIAEGVGRWSPKDRACFYELSKASALELRHHLIVAGDLQYLKPDPGLDERLDSLCAMLYRARETILSRSEGT